MQTTRGFAISVRKNSRSALRFQKALRSRVAKWIPRATVLLTASDLENQKQETAVLPVAKPPLNSLAYFARANRTVRSLRDCSQQNLRQSPVTDWHPLQAMAPRKNILNGRVGQGFSSAAIPGV